MQCTSQRGLQSLAYVPLGLSSKETQTLDQWESHKYTNDRQCSALCNMHQSIVNLTALADNLIKNTASALPINFWYHLHAGVHRLQILFHSRPKSLDLTWHLHITAGKLAHDWEKWEQQGTTVFLKDASITNIAEKSLHSNTLKAATLSVLAKPNGTQQACLWSRSWEYHSQNIIPWLAAISPQLTSSDPEGGCCE